MSQLKSLYDKLPYPMRMAVASARGYQLRWWRRGPHFYDEVEATLERDTWSTEKWDSWRGERLAKLLHHAATTVPFYQQQWQLRRRNGDKASWEQIDNWPILEKQAVRRTPAAFLSEKYDKRRLFELHTSGTTGLPLTLWHSRSTLTTWNAQIEARRLRWHGVSHKDRFALIGGQVVAPVTQEKPPFWVWNRPMNQLYMSSYHLAPQFLPSYLQALRDHEIVYLWGYSSSLHALARTAIRHEATDLKMKVSLTSAEPLLPNQKVAIEKAFGTVCETYGLTEANVAASQCPEAGNMHLWPDTGVVEVVAGDSVLLHNEVGDFVATGLFHREMPLIRYRVGDRGSVTDKIDCACGRTLPLLGEIEGRSDDVLWTKDGRAIGRLDPIFKANIPIVEAQIIQESLSRVRIKYVPVNNQADEAMRTVSSALKERMGDIEVVLENVPMIPRGANGKFRAVISHASRPN